METVKLSDGDGCTYESYSWPVTTIDGFEGREWVHLSPPRYYLHHREGCWYVIDRTMDLSASRPAKTKNRAIRLFLRQFHPAREAQGFILPKVGSRRKPA